MIIIKNKNKTVFFPSFCIHNHVHIKCHPIIFSCHKSNMIDTQYENQLPYKGEITTTWGGSIYAACYIQCVYTHQTAQGCSSLTLVTLRVSPLMWFHWSSTIHAAYAGRMHSQSNCWLATTLSEMLFSLASMHAHTSIPMLTATCSTNKMFSELLFHAVKIIKLYL